MIFLLFDPNINNFQFWEDHHENYIWWNLKPLTIKFWISFLNVSIFLLLAKQELKYVFFLVFLKHPALIYCYMNQLCCRWALSQLRCSNQMLRLVETMLTGRIYNSKLQGNLARLSWGRGTGLLYGKYKQHLFLVFYSVVLFHLLFFYENIARNLIYVVVYRRALHKWWPSALTVLLILIFWTPFQSL